MRPKGTMPVPLEVVAHSGGAEVGAGLVVELRNVRQMGERLKPAQRYASLPSFLSSESTLIMDRSGAAVLAVKPNYREHRNVPGGIMEAGEPPHLCCAREVPRNLASRRR